MQADAASTTQQNERVLGMVVGSSNGIVGSTAAASEVTVLQKDAEAEAHVEKEERKLPVLLYTQGRVDDVLIKAFTSVNSVHGENSQVTAPSFL
jgi:hypothetical protein